MIDTISLSQEWQITLPEAFKMNFPASVGMRFMLYSDGESILLKSVMQPSAGEFKQQMRKCQELAAKSGLTEDDIAKSIETVRARRKNANSH